MLGSKLPYLIGVMVYPIQRWVMRYCENAGAIRLTHVESKARVVMKTEATRTAITPDTLRKSNMAIEDPPFIRCFLPIQSYIYFGDFPATFGPEGTGGEIRGSLVTVPGAIGVT